MLANAMHAVIQTVKRRVAASGTHGVDQPTIHHGAVQHINGMQHQPPQWHFKGSKSHFWGSYWVGNHPTWQHAYIGQGHTLRTEHHQYFKPQRHQLQHPILR